MGIGFLVFLKFFGLDVLKESLVSSSVSSGSSAKDNLTATDDKNEAQGQDKGESNGDGDGDDGKTGGKEEAGKNLEEEADTIEIEDNVPSDPHVDVEKTAGRQQTASQAKDEVDEGPSMTKQLLGLLSSEPTSKGTMLEEEEVASSAGT